MLTVSSADINLWVAGLLWPLARILGPDRRFSPLLGNSAVAGSA